MAKNYENSGFLGRIHNTLHSIGKPLIAGLAAAYILSHSPPDFSRITPQRKDKRLKPNIEYALQNPENVPQQEANISSGEPPGSDDLEGNIQYILSGNYTPQRNNSFPSIILPRKSVAEASVCIGNLCESDAYGSITSPCGCDIIFNEDTIAVYFNGPGDEKGFDGRPIHGGVDINLPIGTPIYAAGSGTAILGGGMNDGIIYIQHSGKNNVYSGYAHLSTILVNDGDQVNRGQIIGLSGMTRTNWPHLHFALLLSDGNHRIVLDPLKKEFWRFQNFDTLSEQCEISYVDEVVAFVSRLYSTVLGRTPDGPGLDWNTGCAFEIGIRDITHAYFHSPEFHFPFGANILGRPAEEDMRLLSALYNTVLGRSYDQGGFVHNLELLRKGLITPKQMVDAFLRSPEFYKRFRNLVDIVNRD